MRIRKAIQRRIRRSANGVDFVGDINAAVAANVGEGSQTTHVSSRSTAVSSQAEKRTDEERPKG